MAPRTLSLLVLRRDRIIRLSVPCWAVYALTMVLTTVLAVGGAMIRATWLDYVALKRQMPDLAGLKRENEEQRQTLASVRDRITEMQSELVTWRDLHAKLWEPFASVAGGARKGASVGAMTFPAPMTASTETGLGGRLEVLASAIRDEGQRLRAYVQFISRAGRVLASIPSRWPLHGTLNSDFGRRFSPWNGKTELHRGIDLGAAAGTPVKAPAPGRVTLAGPKSDFGLAVILDHGNDIQSLYGHLGQVQVKPGQQVERGQVVALSGSSGRTTGPHLHYEVWVKGEPANPRGFLGDR